MRVGIIGVLLAVSAQEHPASHPIDYAEIAEYIIHVSRPSLSLSYYYDWLHGPVSDHLETERTRVLLAVSIDGHPASYFMEYTTAVGYIRNASCPSPPFSLQLRLGSPLSAFLIG